MEKVKVTINSRNYDLLSYVKNIPMIPRDKGGKSVDKESVKKSGIFLDITVNDPQNQLVTVNKVDINVLGCAEIWARNVEAGFVVNRNGTAVRISGDALVIINE